MKFRADPRRFVDGMKRARSVAAQLRERRRRVEELSTVPRGWTADGWIDRLRILAKRCRPLHPDTADELLEAAEAISGPLRDSGA